MTYPESVVEVVAKALDPEDERRPLIPGFYRKHARAAIDAYNEAMEMQVDRQLLPDGPSRYYRFISRWIADDEKT